MSETSDQPERREASPTNQTREPAITDHVEPLAQGGERYVRCEACGRELLCARGGQERLLHTNDCLLGEANR